MNPMNPMTPATPTPHGSNGTSPHASAPLSGKERILTRLAVWALAFGLLSVLVVAVSGPLNRFGIVHFRVALGVFRWGVMIGVGAAILGFLGIIAAIVRSHPSGNYVRAGIGFALGMLMFSAGNAFKSSAESLPRIHDITTDTDNPPAFVAAVPLRTPEMNPLAYEGAAVAEQQKKAYPDVKPLILDLPREQGFERALAAAREMGWEILAAVPAEGRIEAVATTAFFGFKDDVVIRVSEGMPGQTRVDVRSVSRVGISDVGANAKRIRQYLAKLSASS